MFCYLDDIIIASNSLEHRASPADQREMAAAGVLLQEVVRGGHRYSTFDRELLAAFSAVRHFRFLLEGRQFRLLTDHKPLVTSLFATTDHGPLLLGRPRRRGRPNSSSNSPSSPNSHQTSDTHQARRTW